MALRILLLVFAGWAFLPISSASGAEVGQAAPHCRLMPLDGKPAHDLPQYKGKVVYVDFWASWCAPCAQSFPFMNQLQQEFKDRGLEVVGVNLDEDREEAKAFLAKHKASFTVAADGGGQCPMDFGVRAMPTSFVIDRKGVIRHMHLGFRPGESEKTRATVEQLLSEP